MSRVTATSEPDTGVSSSPVSSTPAGGPVVVRLPALGVQLWHGAKHLLEATVIPLGLFYVLFTFAGLHPAVLVALGWALAVLAWRVVTGRSVSALLILMIVLLGLRTGIGYVTGSVYLYFLLPVVQDSAIGVAFLVMLPFRSPLLARLAADLCVFPPQVTDSDRVRRFFRRASVLWAVVFLACGGLTLWLLSTVSLGVFLITGPGSTYALVGLTVVASVLWFRRTLRAEGIQLQLPMRLRDAPAAAPKPRTPAAIAAAPADTEDDEAAA